MPILLPFDISDKTEGYIFQSCEILSGVQHYDALNPVLQRNKRQIDRPQYFVGVKFSSVTSKS